MEPTKRRKPDERKRRIAKNGQDRRAEILAAAVESVVVDGYARTSVSQVSRRARVPRPLVQYYFPTRELMLRAAIDKILENWEAGYFLSAATENSAASDITNGVRRLWAHMQEPSYRAVQELRYAARTDPALDTMLDELHEADLHRRRAQAVLAFSSFSSADPAAFVAARAFTTIFIEGLLQHRFGRPEETSDAETQLEMLSALLTTFWSSHGVPEAKPGEPSTGSVRSDELGPVRRLVAELGAQLDVLAKRSV